MQYLPDISDNSAQREMYRAMLIVHSIIAAIVLYSYYCICNYCLIFSKKEMATCNNDNSKDGG
jgi:hypothetical protein